MRSCNFAISFLVDSMRVYITCGAMSRAIIGVRCAVIQVSILETKLEAHVSEA